MPVHKSKQVPAAGIRESPEKVKMDFVTLMSPAEGQAGLLTKIWDADGRIHPAASIVYYQAKSEPVADLDDLAGLLDQIAEDSRTCIIRAVPAPGRDPARLRRTTRDQGLEPDLVDTPHHWFCIDLDHVAAPGLDVNDPDAIGAFLWDLLPYPLNAAEFIVQLSASMGHPMRVGELRAHLWFWATEKRDSATLKRWIKSLIEAKSLIESRQLDTSTLSAAQIHFTARPLIVNGADPIVNRCFIVPGAGPSVTVPEAPPEDASDRKVIPLTAARFASPKALRAFIDLIEQTGVLRSKSGAAMERPARIAYLDILVNELGQKNDLGELRTLFWGGCIGPDDHEAEADFREAIAWMAQPAGERLRAGSILTELRERGTDAPTLAKIEFIYSALKQMNVEAARPAPGQLYADWMARQGLPAPPASISPVSYAVRPAPNVVPIMAAAVPATAKDLAVDDDAILRELRFPIIEKGRGLWTVGEAEIGPGFILEKDNKPRPIAENLFILLTHAGGAVRHNKWTNKIEYCLGYGTPEPIGRFYKSTIWELGNNLNIGWKDLSTNFVDLATEALARRNAYDPMVDYLDELCARDAETFCGRFYDLESWLPAVLHVEDSPYHRAVGRYLIGGMIRRILDPGCKSDEMVVIMSEQQGYEKSGLGALLAPWPEAYIANMKLGVSSKEVLELTGGKAVVEVGEMSQARTSEIETIRTMLSTQVDIARMAYDKGTTEGRRRFIMYGTSNNLKPLRDPYGARRFLPVVIDRPIDVDAFERIREWLYRLAVQELRNSKTTFRISRELWAVAASAQESATDCGNLYDYLEAEIGPKAEHRFEVIRGAEIISFAQRHYRNTNGKSLTNTMEKLGFRKGRSFENGRQVRVWYRENVIAQGHKIILADAQKGTVWMTEYTGTMHF